ncbi:methionine ABC transporter ATP-binding protein [Calditerricola satsumensis]|uniref:Methionine import ATP-binding protein MetN 3 n=1 Tax=Calditerricola satsumensis TaxID=373054 RepID=A0A8J3FE57_9BACI|nr:ATP-binding cassette domain-containing protein [Calditerricola satsumensis]GGK07093.1 methionine import ATP-binding protein MetN 3 [Calditerricola satsumensis]
MIKLQGIRKTFSTGGKTVEVLKGIDLSVQKGEVFGLIGRSGAGKSTLLRIINLLERPSAGRVVVDGVELTALSERELRRARQRIGMVFQHFHLLWSRTVRENIALPLEIAGVPKREIRQRVDELVELVGLTERADAYPAQLSGGQKQRVGIARALANRPHVLLCDEATSALDPETTDQILDLLRSINRRFGLTVVLVTHEMDVIQAVCDRVAVMEGGRIVEVGPVAEVVARPQTETARRFLQQGRAADRGRILGADIPHVGPAAGSEGSAVAAGSEAGVSAAGEGAVEVFLRLELDGVSAPVVETAIRRFAADIRLCEGSLAEGPGGVRGALTVRVSGAPAVVQGVIEYWKAAGVAVTPLETLAERRVRA